MNNLEFFVLKNNQIKKNKLRSIKIILILDFFKKTRESISTHFKNNLC